MSIQNQQPTSKTEQASFRQSTPSESLDCLNQEKLTSQSRFYVAELKIYQFENTSVPQKVCIFSILFSLIRLYLPESPTYMAILHLRRSTMAFQQHCCLKQHIRHVSTSQSTQERCRLVRLPSLAQLIAQDMYSALPAMCSLAFLNVMSDLPAAPTKYPVAQRSPLQPTHTKYHNQCPGTLPSPTQNAGGGKEAICYVHSHLFNIQAHSQGTVVEGLGHNATIPLLPKGT